jgi:predicted CXXCH cytochrome family protein
MRFVPREESHREVGAFGDVDPVHGVSCGTDAGRHDDAEPGDAEGFACHEKSAELQQHVPVVKGPCMDCHDAHSSDQRMLLRTAAGPPLSALKKR